MFVSKNLNAINKYVKRNFRYEDPFVRWLDANIIFEVFFFVIRLLLLL